MKAPVKNYLSITKKEWNGMVVLIILIALVLAAPYAYQTFSKDNTINFNQFDKDAVILAKASNNTPEDDDALATSKPVKAKLFKFNPNDLSVADWQKLGLTEHQAGVIKNYEAKGGKFYSKADVKKMYSITDAEYKQLEPYINLPANDNYTKKATPGEVIEINSADSARLTMIRGIGPSFARRIVKYRERLGGFYSKEQLKEVYGIDAEKYAEIKEAIMVNSKNITKVDINKATFDQLRRFPYLSFKQINAILEYHNQHGDYESVADLKNIAILDDGILRKIGPYLVFK